MRLYIVRHGETNLNREKRLQGQLNEPLNQLGVDLAIETGRGLKDVHFDMAIASPLVRAYDTARLILSQNTTSSNLTIAVDPRLIEIDWGCWDKKVCRGDQYEVPIEREEFNKFYDDPFNFCGAPDGETIAEVCKRTKPFMDEIISNETFKDKTILIGMHGCSMRALLNPLYNDPSDFWQGRIPMNCAVNIVDVIDGKASIIEEDKIFYDPAITGDIYKK